MPVQPHLLIDAGDVSEKAIVAGDPGRIERMAQLLDDVREVSRNRGYLVMRGRYAGKDLTLCAHGIGAPSAAIVFSELWRCGVKEMIRVGTCGGLRPGMQRGDLVIATAAVRDEGTTLHYVPAGYPAVADATLARALAAAAERRGVHYREGIVWSTDIYYARDPSSYRDWAERGVLAVEMEVSTLLTLATLRGRRAAAILVVDGNVIDADQNRSGSQDEAGRPSQHDPATRAGIDVAVAIALDAI